MFFGLGENLSYNDEGDETRSRTGLCGYFEDKAVHGFYVLTDVYFAFECEYGFCVSA